MIQQFLNDENGQTLVEYGLLLVLVAVVAVAVITILGNKVNNNLYGKVKNQLSN